MIVVSGSIRSGTSLWMQILHAAGLPVIGDAFPEAFDDALREANPRGFYESALVNGVYFATNPHPESGAFLHPQRTRRHAVKVFVPGLLRTDMAYLDRVIVTVRERRAYAASVGAFPVETTRGVQLSPSLRWWSEVTGAIRNVQTRGYPAHVVAYETLLQEPQRVVSEVLDWIGGELDREAAIACVEPRLQRSRAGVDDDVESADARVMDDVYRHIREEQAFDEQLVRAVDALDARLRPVFEAAQQPLLQQTVRELLQG